VAAILVGGLKAAKLKIEKGGMKLKKNLLL
jgi:hypothetical protein